MAGTGIGTFNDRLRDAARGGGPFARQAGAGLHQRPVRADPTAPIRAPRPTSSAPCCTQMDLVGGPGGQPEGLPRCTDRDGEHGEGLPGGLRRPARPATPRTRRRSSTTSPRTTTRRCSTRVQVKAAARHAAWPSACACTTWASALVALAQGIPFFHAGDELLRSKSVDRNSYNSGDWFNRIDWTYKSNNWGVGLPPARTTGNWRCSGRCWPTPRSSRARRDIVRALDHFEEMLTIRKSTRLFRLQTADEINQTVKYYLTGTAAVPAVMVMGFDNNGQFAKDYDHVLVVFNASTKDAVAHGGRVSRAASTCCTRCSRRPRTIWCGRRASTAPPALSRCRNGPPRCSCWAARRR